MLAFLVYAMEQGVDKHVDLQGTLLTDSIGACYIHCDVAKESDVESAIQLAITWKGKLDILFSNAGIGGIASSITSLDMEQGNETTPEQVKTLVGEEGILLRGKAATVEDVAKAAVFLASDDYGFITAHNLVIDGGYTSAISSEFHLQVVKN
ncbi:hypothetical protein Gohar_020933 [Gossypium harknessii]|uniref:Uncharacterized protein n=1 Tax=Gossypium harknessii TaxID=34285 RepID=A0A7J9HZ80_9ROSI|nr:hypothetical protein [Gossypium harknessii]